VRRVAKKIEMLKRLYQVVVEGRTEFAWRDFFILLAPVASHSYIQNTLYNLMGRGVLVKQDHRYIVNVGELLKLLREHDAI
jgi:succinylglutamate desuccinylase